MPSGSGWCCELPVLRLRHRRPDVPYLRVVVVSAPDLDSGHCCDWWPHDADEACLYSACDCCGGFFSLGPSSSPTCYVCALGEATLPAETFRELNERVPTAPLNWDERPF